MSEHRLDEILIERPRQGWRQKTPRGNKLMRQITKEASTDGLLCPYRIKTRHRTKYFSDHLGPLRRFLRSKIGQPWDTIYGELSQRLDRNTVVGQHVLTHLWDYVYLHVEMVDDVPYSKAGSNGWRGGYQLGRWRNQFYIHPENGLLCLAKPQASRPRKRSTKTQDCIALDGNGATPLQEEYRQYRKIDGIWYEVEFRVIPRYELVWDVVLKQTVGSVLQMATRTSDHCLHCNRHTHKFHGQDIYAFRKRQCNKKELKMIRQRLEAH